MRRFSYIFAGVTLAFAANAASAQTTVYKGFDSSASGASSTVHPLSDAASGQFQSALSGTSTESFETFSSGAGTPLALSFTGSAGSLDATLTGSGNVAGSASGSGAFAVGGSKYYTASSSSFGITFASAVAAFGFYSTDIESDVKVTLTHASGPSEVYSYFTLYGTAGGVPSGSVNFLGLINVNNPFTSVVFSPGPNSSGFNGDDIFSFDLMTIGDASQVVNPPAVPEPSTWAMMIMGIGIVGAVARRRRVPTTSLA